MIYVLFLYLHQDCNNYEIYVMTIVKYMIYRLTQKKSMCMHFSIDINKHCRLPVIYLGNCVCQFVKEVKYLGVDDSFFNENYY